MNQGNQGNDIEIREKGGTRRTGGTRITRERRETRRIKETETKETRGTKGTLGTRHMHTANMGMTNPCICCIYGCISGKPIISIMGPILLHYGTKVGKLLGQAPCDRQFLNVQVCFCNHIYCCIFMFISRFCSVLLFRLDTRD